MAVATEFYGLGFLPGGIASSGAIAVSGDGNTVVGSAYINENDGVAVRWTRSGGLVSLGDLPGGLVRAEAWGASADGRVIVGNSTSSRGREAFRWTAETGMTQLGDLPDGVPLYSSSLAVSDDGSIIVGLARSSESTPERAFRWTQQNGISYLEAETDAEGRLLRPHMAAGVSADGNVVVGAAAVGGASEPYRWTQSTGLMSLGESDDLPV